MIYFYRDFDQEGKGTLFTVKENGVVIGTLKAGTFFYHYAEPGRHYYSVIPVGSDTNKENGTFIQVLPETKHYVQALPQLNQEGELEALAFVKFREQARSTIDRLTYREADSREEAF